MKATLEDALQQRQHEEDGRREVKRHKRVLRKVLCQKLIGLSRRERTASLSL